MSELKYHRHLEAIAKADVAYVKRKDTQYQASWKRRGGQGAFFTMVRPWDRLESIARTPASATGIGSYDLFGIIGYEGLEGPDGSLIACVRDLRRYLLLLEAEMVERSDDAFKEITKPGTPEDGGHHARQEYLEDGLTERPANENYLPVIDPITNKTYWNLNRPAYDPTAWDHLARLRQQLNNKEWEETAPEYRGMYTLRDYHWHLNTAYRNHWGPR